MIEFTDTIPPIEFERSETGPNGTRFILHPNAVDHTDQDVIRAKRWLKATRNVWSMEIRWALQGDNDPTLMKIPDHIIIRNLRTELGKKETYIQELEEKIEQISRGADAVARKEAKKDAGYKNFQIQLDKAKAENTSLRKQLSELVIRINTKT